MSKAASPQLAAGRPSITDEGALPQTEPLVDPVEELEGEGAPLEVVCGLVAEDEPLLGVEPAELLPGG